MLKPKYWVEEPGQKSKTFFFFFKMCCFPLLYIVDRPPFVFFETSVLSNPGSELARAKVSSSWPRSCWPSERSPSTPSCSLGLSPSSPRCNLDAFVIHTAVITIIVKWRPGWCDCDYNLCFFRIKNHDLFGNVFHDHKNHDWWCCFLWLKIMIGNVFMIKNHD